MHQSSVRKANAAAAKRVSKGAARLVKGGPAAQDAKDAAAWGTSRSSSTFPLPPSTAKAPMTDNHSFTSAPNSIGGFAPPSPISPPWMRPQASDPASWNNNPHPPGGFMSFFNNQAPRPVDIGGSSSPLMGTPTPQPDQDPISVDSEDEAGRTEKRILWTQEEDVRLMSSWLKNSQDSALGADRRNDQYWGDVAKTYNMTTPAHRRRNPKQAKDRWHKINKWTDLFNCAWVKARRIYTSGYSDQNWIDMAHKFYVEDNKKLKLGHFVLMDVWYLCRNEAKWITYNDELKESRKRKALNQVEEGEENSEVVVEGLKRPIGQKAAKKVAYAAKCKSKGIEIDEKGRSKESAIDVDKLDRFSKIQAEANENRMKVLEMQQKLSSEKLESTRIAHLAAVANKEAKMIEGYTSLLSRDTSTMSNEEKVEHVAALKCFRKTLFPESI